MIALIHLWFFPILTVLLIILPFWKKSRERYGVFTDKANLSKDESVVSKLRYPLSFFEYLVKNNSLIHFSWSLGFILWIISCFLWVFGAEFFSNVLFSGSIVFCLVSIFGAVKIKAKKSINFESGQLGLSIYLAIFSISVLVAISFHSFAEGIMANLVLLTFVFVFRVLKN